MKINPINNSNVSFGVKIPTKQVVNLISGLSVDNPTKLLSDLTGTDEVILYSQIDSAVFEFASKDCVRKLCDQRPELQNLRRLAQDMSDKIRTYIGARSEDNLKAINVAAAKREAESEAILKSFPELMDITPVKVGILSKGRFN